HPDATVPLSFPTRRSSDLGSALCRRCPPPEDLGYGQLCSSHALSLPHLGDPSLGRPHWDGPLPAPPCRGSLLLQAVSRRASHVPDRKSTRLNSSHVKMSYA